MVTILASACSGSGPHADRSPDTTEVPTSGASPTTATTITEPTTTGPTSTEAPATVPAATIPPTITTTPVTDSSGHVTAVITKVDGTGAATIPLPASAGLPAIVHAQHESAAKFVVTNVDAAGHYLSIAAQSTGKYDGTFPLGFVDQHNDPTGGLDVATTGPWHLDIAPASLAPPLPPSGVAGQGDAVLSYTGPGASAEVAYPGKSTFTIETFANGLVKVLTNAVGPYRRRIALPAGPAFISVTAGGKWSIKLG